MPYLHVSSLVGKVKSVSVSSSVVDLTKAVIFLNAGVSLLYTQGLKNSTINYVPI